MSTTLTPNETAERDAFAQWVFQETTAALEMLTVYLGVRLGLYRRLAESGPMSPRQLAARSGLDQRYVREWLEQQAVAGVLSVPVDEGEVDPDDRPYALPAAHAEVLLNRDSLAHLGPCALAIPALSGAVPLVVDAFRTGHGVPYAAYGADLRHFIAEINRPMFVNQLAGEWLAAAPDLVERLRARPPARVADVGCGTGWSSLSLARAFPAVEVHGIDLDPASVEEARRNAMDAGLTDRVTFACQDAAHPDLTGSFDLVTAFETLHDMAHPVDALTAMRTMLAPGGSVVIADEKVADRFSAPGDELERWNYAWSVLHCLPAGRTDRGSEATGTVLRASMLRQLAERAEFTNVEVLPVDNDFWRIYRLRP
jgi:2-polyprenyl-3-methyl-5-hydroxy-6-metoxy-1,4-benzoquinol methylase